MKTIQLPNPLSDKFWVNLKPIFETIVRRLRSYYPQISEHFPSIVICTTFVVSNNNVNSCARYIFEDKRNNFKMWQLSQKGKNIRRLEIIRCGTEEYKSKLPPSTKQKQTNTTKKNKKITTSFLQQSSSPAESVRPPWTTQGASIPPPIHTPKELEHASKTNPLKKILVISSVAPPWSHYAWSPPQMNWEWYQTKMTNICQL